MSLKEDLLRLGTKALHYCNSNAPTILTVTAMIGVVATAIISAECKKAAEDAIKEEEKELNRPLEKVERFKRTWYFYIPPFLTSALTIGAIGGAQSINKKRQLEMIAAYNILKEGSDKFKKYAIEEIGKNKVQKIEHKVNEEDLKEHPVAKENLEAICDAATGGVILKDKITGQEFTTTYEKIYQAGERVNTKLRNFSGGGYDWWSYSDFIEDCGGDYSEAAEGWGWMPIPFKDPIDVNNMCDPHVEDYKGHRCTVVYLNLWPERKSLYDPSLY